MLYGAALLPILMAGFMNGSFVIPARYIKNIAKEKIWLYHSMGLIVIPWVILAFTAPVTVYNYLSLSPSILAFLIFSGIIWGIGQVCFVYAIAAIGIALSFTINLGIGATLGSMFAVFYRATFFTPQGYWMTVAIVLIIASLIIYYYSGKSGDKQQNSNQYHRTQYHRGWVLASLTGVATGLQNIVFILVTSDTKLQNPATNTFWVWPLFLLVAAIPMLFCFSFKLRGNPINAISTKGNLLTVKNVLLIGLMGLFFTGSLALYSEGMGQLTQQQQLMGWPVFMVAIIFTSQLWGWWHQESKDVMRRNKYYLLTSMLLLVIAVILLAVKT